MPSECIWVMPLLNLIKLFTPFSVLRVYFLFLLREMFSQHNCWTCMCKESYQEGEKWKAKRQFKAFWKYIYWSYRSYPRIHSGMTTSLVLLDTVTFLQVEEENKGDEKRWCITWTEHIYVNLCYNNVFCWTAESLFVQDVLLSAQKQYYMCCLHTSSRLVQEWRGWSSRIVLANNIHQRN